MMLIGQDVTLVFSSLTHIQGEYREAEQLFRRGIEIIEDTLGRDNQAYSVMLQNLAQVLFIRVRAELLPWTTFCSG